MGSGTWSVGGDVVLTSGDITGSSATLIMNGSSPQTLTGYLKSVKSLTISNATTIDTSDFYVGNGASSALTVDSLKTLTINSGRTLTVNDGAATNLNGTITGLGTLTLTDTAGLKLSIGGTLSSIVRFDAVTAGVTVPARTYGGKVEFYNNTASTYTATLGTALSQTLTFSGNFNPITNSSGDLIVSAADNSPAINITGSVSFTKVLAGVPSISMGSGTWSVGGNVDLTGGNLTRGDSNLKINGASEQTITSASNLFNAIIITNASSGGVTFADHLHCATFTCTTNAARIYFAVSPVEAHTVTTALILTGGATTKIVLGPSGAGTWDFSSPGSNTVTGVSISDSHSSVINAYNSTNATHSPTPVGFLLTAPKGTG